jgi:hypothetical protein
MSATEGRYRRVYVKLWMALAPLDNSLRVLALYLLTGPQTNRLGLYRLSPGAAAEDLSTPSEPLTTDDVVGRLADVCRVFDWHYDAVARVIWIPSWWRFNPPENPSVMQSLVRDLGELPPCALLERFAANTADLSDKCADVLRAAIKTPVATPVKTPVATPVVGPVPHQEQDQDQEQGSAAHDAFWSRYPKQQGRPSSVEAWRELKPSAETVAAIMAGLERFRKTPAIQKALADRDVTFIPLPKTWLRDRRWEDTHAVNIGKPPAPTVCQHRHTPPCADAAACSRRYLDDMRGDDDANTPTRENDAAKSSPTDARKRRRQVVADRKRTDRVRDRDGPAR